MTAQSEWASDLDRQPTRPPQRDYFVTIATASPWQQNGPTTKSPDYRGFSSMGGEGLEPPTTCV